MSNVIKKNSVVAINYVLKDDDGGVIDQSRGQPLAFLQGHHNIVPGLEKAMLGHKTGDSFHVDVIPAEGYGERHEVPPQLVPHSAFPKGMQLFPGMPLGVQNENGEQMQVFVKEVTQKGVLLDVNHPLAGKTLHFDIEVVEVRPASKEELAHGHVHGPGGHHH